MVHTLEQKTRIDRRTALAKVVASGLAVLSGYGCQQNNTYKASQPLTSVADSQPSKEYVPTLEDFKEVLGEERIASIQSRYQQFSTLPQETPAILKKFWESLPSDEARKTVYECYHNPTLYQTELKNASTVIDTIHARYTPNTPTATKVDIYATFNPEEIAKISLWTPLRNEKGEIVDADKAYLHFLNMVTNDPLDPLGRKNKKTILTTK